MVARVCASLMLLTLVGLGCDDAAGERGGSVRTASPAASPAAAGDDDEVETVDDTVPPDDAASAPAGAGADSEGAEAEGEVEDDPDAACAPKTPGLKPMQVLRFAFTDGIEGKDPKSKLSVAKAGQRVYAHLAMRNRSGRKRCLHMTFRVGGKKRTSVTLKVGKSWEWRTYAYNTLRADDNKPLELTVTDDQGALVLKKMLPVIPRKKD